MGPRGKKRPSTKNDGQTRFARLKGLKKLRCRRCWTILHQASRFYYFPVPSSRCVYHHVYPGGFVRRREISTGGPIRGFSRIVFEWNFEFRAEDRTIDCDASRRASEKSLQLTPGPKLTSLAPESFGIRGLTFVCIFFFFQYTNTPP